MKIEVTDLIGRINAKIGMIFCGIYVSIYRLDNPFQRSTFAKMI